ncbi:MAG: MFS transporter, partial [Oscillospiraceae bacterium]
MAKLQNKKWHRLDNTANLFPVIVSHSRTNVFRMTATLKENVIPENLQQALNDTLPNFPNFSVRLKNGLFWAYLETSNAVPQVSEEKYLPCRYIDCRARNSLLFRVLYFEKNIHLEVF